MEYKIVEIPIIKSNFSKTKSARFKGTLEIVSNQDGIIYDWNIFFTEVYIDAATTPSWFNKKTTTFKRRAQLFALLGIVQIPRRDRYHNEIIKLNNEQINILNKYLNNREQYNSTLKNIIGILKGNNPGGEAAKPKSAEMVIDADESYKNFVILLDDLTVSNKGNFSLYKIGAKKITLQDYVLLNENIESSFNYMQQNKGNIDFSIYLQSIKVYVAKYRRDINSIEQIISKARSKYMSNVDKIDPSDYAFDVKKGEFQRAHIVPVWFIKDKILECIQSGRKYLEFIEMIYDRDNFLPLPWPIHSKYDSGELTYDENGEINLITIGALSVKEYEYFDRYKKIKGSWMNEQRKQYLMMHNAIYADRWGEDV